MTPHDLPDEWIAAIQDALRALGGPRWSEPVAARWRDRAGQPAVYVTVYGPYDAGKTTLIKRLLVADATDTPEWLAVSGHPQTDACQQVESGGLVYVDTPGTASGNPAADELAHEAAALTDALLVVVTPQLLGGDSDRMLATVRDTFAAAPRSVLFAIAQSEAAQVDPSDDPDAYRELVDRKRAELLALLAKQGIAVAASAVHAVSADPFGLVGPAAAPKPEDYAAGAGWDGIDELRRDLAALTGQRAVLRRAGAIRYWRAVGTQAVAEADEQIATLRSSLDDACRLKERARFVEKELDATDTAATAELRAAVESELLSAAGTVQDATVDVLLPVVEQRLQARLDAWLAVWGGRLQRVAESAQSRLPTNMSRPAAGTFRSYLERVTGSATAPAEDGTGRWQVAAIVSRADRHAGQLAGELFKHRHGMSIEVARVELEKIRDLDATKLAEYFAVGGRFTDAKHVESVKMSLHTTNLVTGILPAVIELGSMVYVHARGAIEAQRARRRRAELLAGIARAAGEIVNRILLGEATDEVGWTAAVQSIRQCLAAGVPDDEVLKGMGEELASLEAARQQLTSVVTGSPSP